MVEDYFVHCGKIIARPRPPLATLDLMCVSELYFDDARYICKSRIGGSVITFEDRNGDHGWWANDEEIPEYFTKLVEFIRRESLCMKVIRR